MNILDELESRGIFKDITNKDKMSNISNDAGVYIGFDPTAESLHLGNYVQMAILKRFEQHGYKAFAVLGGATGMIGDPSGKKSERNLLNEETLNANKDAISKQLSKYQMEVIDNIEFYKNMGALEFLRDIGKLLNVNYMTSKEVVASRLETGISFTEFSYQLIQGWDFKRLYDEHNVRIQIGGSDQWGNITSGIEIIRKTNGDDNLAVGITTNLLTTTSGAKFGKSEGNALWLDKKMTSPFELYQYLLSTNDSDVEKYLKWLTFISVSEIEKIISAHENETFRKTAQAKLAYEVVKDIHGVDEAERAIMITSVLYQNGDISKMSATDVLELEGSVPTFENISGNILEVLININLASSKREAREFIQSGSISINGEKVDNENYDVENNGFDGKANIIRRGKKKTALIKY